MRSLSTFIRLSSAIVALSLAMPALAATPVPGQDSWSIDVGGDTYAAGGAVDMAERVDGDLLAAAGMVVVESGVTGDVFLAGGKIDVNGTVKDDVRVAGGQVRLRGAIGGDLVVFGGEVYVEEGATVAGDTLIMGGSVEWRGTAEGDLRVEADDAVIAGEVKGNAYLRGARLDMRSRVLGNATIVAESFKTSPQARIEGNLEYWLGTGVQSFASIVGGTAAFRPELEPSTFRADAGSAAAGLGLGLLAGLSIYGILAAALFIVVLLLLTRTHFVQAAKTLRKKPWSCLGVGFATLCFMPIVGILLCVTVVGIPLGLFTFFLWGFTLVFLRPLAALILARLLEQAWGKAWGFWMTLLWSLLIYVLLKALTVIPVLGWALAAILCFAALGAHVRTKWERYKKVR